MAAQQEDLSHTYYNNAAFAHIYAKISPRLPTTTPASESPTTTLASELPNTIPSLGYTDLIRHRSNMETQNVKKKKRAFCIPIALIIFGVLVVAVAVILGMLIFTGKYNLLDTFFFHDSFCFFLSYTTRKLY